MVFSSDGPSHGPGDRRAGAWSARPPLWSLALFYAAYVVAGGLGQGLAIVPGVSITFWPPAGIFVATLLSSPRPSWAWWVLAGGAAELTCNAVWFANPVPLALVYYSANALEALAAAWLIGRFTARPFRLESLPQVAAFVVLGAGVAPVVGATVIAVTDALLGKHAFTTAWVLVWLGDGSGLLVSTPLTLLAVHAWRERARILPRRIAEAVALAVALVVVAALCLRGDLPTVYLTLPPLLWAALRFQLPGAAAALGVLTLMTALFTMTGRGEFAGDAARLREKMVMLQTFLGVSAVSALLVAALSRQHQQAVRRLQAVNDELEARVAERTATLRDSEGKLRLFIDNAPAALAMFDRSMRYLAASRRWKSDYGLGGAELIGRSHDEVFPELPEAWKEAHRRGLAGEALASAGDRFDGADGSPRWVKWEILPWRAASGEVGGILVATEDITASKLAEDALRDADRRKDEFLAVLAHELRNPLAPVRNAVHVLRLKGPAVPELQWARDVIDRQVQAMTRLIDDLMDLSRINRDRIELRRERVELARVVQGAVETSRPLIEELGHELTVSLPPGPVTLDGDLTRLAQVFLNLLNNAAKYTEPGGRIWLTAERQGSDVVVAVRDAGIGIPADKLPTIFEMFSQVEGALSRSRGGLGIGLCLVKRLVEMHGGRVTAHSEGLGQGSEFAVRLPVVIEQAAPLDRAADRAPPTSDLRILVVDDNQDAAESLAMLLKMMGNHVRTAHDGEAAVAAAAEARPHVVLCDIGLPKLNGYQVCRRIRQEPWGAGMILVAVTGWGQDADRQSSREAGFDHHMVKPVDPQALMKLLSALDIVKPAAGATPCATARTP